MMEIKLIKGYENDLQLFTNYTVINITDSNMYI
jgi:hypothetical protein